jgi:hypothetical protein
MYFGEPYVIDTEDTLGSITVYSPSIGDVMRLGEAKFFASLNILINNTTSYRLMLWDAGIDWCEISDFELFITLYKTLQKEVTALLFGDLDFQKFELMKKVKDDKEVITLVNKEQDVEIDEVVYQHIHQYLQNVFGIFPDEKIPEKGSMLKEWYITKDRRELKNQEQLEKEGKRRSISMQATISACVNHPGFKYKLSELKDVGVCEFYDSVKRLQIYENATACLKGLYSGMVDGKKIDAESYNFMRDK